MFHNSAAQTVRKTLSPPGQAPGIQLDSVRSTSDTQSRPQLVVGRPAAQQDRRSARTAAWPELLTLAARRGSAFMAEAAVLVLVFGILDFFLQRGRMDIAWAAGALVISVGLLAGSVLTDFGARRWLGAHP